MDFKKIIESLIAELKDSPESVDVDAATATLTEVLEGLETQSSELAELKKSGEKVVALEQEIAGYKTLETQLRATITGKIELLYEEDTPAKRDILKSLETNDIQKLVETGNSIEKEFREKWTGPGRKKNIGGEKANVDIKNYTSGGH